jgi:hypothetical protein
MQRGGKVRVMRRGGMISILSRLAFAAGFAVCSLAGCSSDGTNGLEKKSAAEVQQQAAAAIKGASSVHVKGTGTSDGKPAQLDLRIQGTSSSGTLTVEKTRIEITTGRITWQEWLARTYP